MPFGSSLDLSSSDGITVPAPVAAFGSIGEAMKLQILASEVEKGATCSAMHAVSIESETLHLFELSSDQVEWQVHPTPIPVPVRYW